MQNNVILRAKNKIINRLVYRLQADVSAINTFIDQNEKLWKNQKKTTKESYCYIANWQPRELASIIPQLVFAQGLVDSNSAKILVLSPRVNKDWVKFNNSFGAEQSIAQKSMADKFYGIIKVLQLILKGGRGAHLLQMCYKNISIGALLYDYIIRRDKKRYTIEQIKPKDCKVIYDFFSNISCVYRMFLNKKPEIYIVFEYTYLEGALAVVAAHFGAKIFQCLANGKIIYLGAGEKAELRYNAFQKKAIEEFVRTGGVPSNYEEIVGEYLEACFKGKGNSDIVNAYMDKRIVTKDEFAEEVGMDREKKSIVIMAHAFSDEPHGSGFLLYQDYFEWYIETLKIAQKIKNVNWIVKAHPSRKVYGEGEEAYNIFIKYRQENMFWFPDEYSTASLAEIADVIITVQGTAGIEFGCLGKQIILAGAAYYSGFGFTMNPHTIEEYEEMLSNLDKIYPSTEEMKKKACKIMYAYIKLQPTPLDEFSNILMDSYLQSINDGNNTILSTLYRKIQEQYDYYINTKFYQAGIKMGQDIEHLPMGTTIISEYNVKI